VVVGARTHDGSGAVNGDQNKNEDAQRKAREAAERRAGEQAERKAREEAERKAREEAERKAREEVERKAAQDAQLKAEQERLVRETRGLSTVEVKKEDGSVVSHDESGRVSKIVDKNQNSREFGYDAVGKLNSIKDSTGTWTTTDGTSWTNEKGEKKTTAARPEVKPDGTVLTVENGNVIAEKTDGTKVTVKKADDSAPTTDTTDGARTVKSEAPVEKPVDRATLEKSVDAIAYACNGGMAIGTDKETINRMLEGKTEAERQAMAEIWKEKHAQGADNYDSATLEEEFKDEMEGAELDKALNLLNKKDGKTDSAGRIHTALIERGQWIEGRWDSVCEKDIRDTVAKMTKEEVDALDADYRNRYGVGVRDAIAGDANLSQATKESIDVYLKGSDQRTADDTIKLSDIALKNHDIDIFQEAWRDAGQPARDRFMTDGGADKILQAFGTPSEDGSNAESADSKLANDYVKKGTGDVATIVEQNTSIMGDNEAAIEQSLKTMSDADRKDYLDGRQLTTGAGSRDLSAMTQEEKNNAQEYYKKTRTALEGAGNDAELCKWEDLIENKDGTLVSKLVAHRGSIYDSDMQDVIGTIEDMDESAWERLKKEQKEGKTEYREQIVKALGTYLSEDEMKRCTDVLDKKLAAESFESAKDVRRDVVTAITDATGFWNDDEKSVFKAIKNMNTAERDLYKAQNPEGEAFRQKLTTAIETSLEPGSERDAALALLKNDCKEDTLQKLFIHAQETDSDEAQVIRDVQKGFRDEPDLRERVINPQTDEDKKFSEAFKNKLRDALGSSDYETFGKPLMEKGELSSALQQELNQGWFDDDEISSYKDVLNASKEERAKILNDDSYAQTVFSHLNEGERKIALNNLKEFDRIDSDPKLSEADRKKSLDAMRDGKMLPEDELHAMMVGGGTDEDGIKRILANMKPEDAEHVKAEYARKYGADLTEAFCYELGGSDMNIATEAIRRKGSQTEEFDYFRDKFYYDSRGIGRELVDELWDGTGHDLDKKYNEYFTAIADANRNKVELTVEQQKRLQDNLVKSYELHIQSQADMANAITDVAITAAAFIPGLQPLSLIRFAKLGLTMGLAAAALKPMIKIALMGSNYEMSNLGLDMASGFVDGALNVAGGAQVAKFLKVGQKAGLKAATTAAEELAEKGLVRASKNTVTIALEDGTSKIVTKEIADTTNALMREAITSGAKQFDEKALKVAAKQLVDPQIGEKAMADAAAKNLSKEALKEVGEKATRDAEEQIANVLRDSLNTSLNLEARKFAERTLNNVGWNAFAGTAGGGASGIVYGAGAWDSSLTFEQNMTRVAQMAGTSAAIGAGAGTIISSTMHFGTEAVQNVAEKRAARSAAAEAVEIERLASKGPGAETMDVADAPDSAVKPEPINARGAEDSIASTTDSFTRGKTVANLNLAIMQRGDILSLNGTEYKLIGFDQTTGGLILENAARKNAMSHGRVVKSDELANNYQPVDYNKQTYYRDRDGQMYQVYDNEGGEVTLVSAPTLKYSTREAVKPVSMNGPENISVAVGDQPVVFEKGRAVIGRGKQTEVSGVSSNHGEMRYDRDSNAYYYKDTNSTNGSYIKRLGETEFTRLDSSVEVEIKPGDELRLGRSGDVRVSMRDMSRKEFPSADSLDFYVNGKPVAMKDGKLSIGRAERFSDGSSIDDSAVSSQHADVTWDAKDGSFYYEDHSTNGSYIKREGSDQFELVQNRKVKIGPSDEIRLGKQDGPLFKLSPARNQDLVPITRSQDVDVNLNGQNLKLQDNELKVGRLYNLGDEDLRVSSHHGTLRFDEGEKAMYYRDRSKNGTFIKREGSNEFEFVRNSEVKIGARDEVRLGSADGPRLNFSDVKTTSAVVDNQVYFGGKALDLSAGEVNIGRANGFGNGENDAFNKLVSRKHGTLRWNQEEGSFQYIDHSDNGTWFRRQGSDQFTRIPSDQPVNVGPFDEIRLGGEAGPQLKISSVKGKTLPDGRIKYERPDGVLMRSNDGSSEFIDHAGTRVFKDANGRVLRSEGSGAVVGRRYFYEGEGSTLSRIEFDNGSTWERVGDSQWKMRSNSGQETSWNGTLEVQADGSYKAVGAGETAATVHRLDGSVEVHRSNGRVDYASADINMERSRLNQLSDHHFSNVNQKRRFDKMVHDFETRVRASNLSEQEIAKTYHQINRLLTAGNDSPLTMLERTRLSEQIMYQAAYPHSIDQGSNGTCNVTTVENRIFTREPSKAASLIADVATTGKYVTADGTVIDLTRVPGAIRPDGQSKGVLGTSFQNNGYADIKVDGARNWAGQIFEVTAVNVKWARSHELKPGEVIIYEKSTGPRYGDTSAEKVKKYSVDEKGNLAVREMSDGPGFYTNDVGELTEVHNQITGGNDRNFVIAHGKYGDASDASTLVKVQSQQQFEAALEQVQRDNNFPAILLVDANQPPFKDFAADPSNGGTGAWHVINIQNIHRDPRTGRMKIEYTNQWGMRSNRTGNNAVDAGDLYRATKRNGANVTEIHANVLREKVAANNPNGAVLTR
jgi:pSer/pThr/pTyr-binding forkhead associated (FHA) protein/3D (Asp-Asp-Asp) domain-containing protein